MKIYIIERNKDKFKYLVPYFDDLDDVTLINSDFKTFLQNNYVQCIVSPANSHGFMTGGFDMAIIDYFGRQVQEKVQNYIIENFDGEQEVGTSFIIDIDNEHKLIHTPTMIRPSKIKDESVVYQCMKQTLLTAKQNNIESILIPMFGGATGGLKPQVIARMMRYVYDEIKIEEELENIRKLKQ